MTSIDDALDDARDAATGFLNAEGRHPGHVALGVAVTVGFALAATLFATRTLAPTRDLRGDGHAPVTERPRGPLSLILPAVFSVTTLSAVRVWNAPPASWPRRSAAACGWRTGSRRRPGRRRFTDGPGPTPAPGRAPCRMARLPLGTAPVLARVGVRC